MQSYAKVVQVKDNKAQVEFNGKTPPVGEIVRVKWGKQRNIQQNNLYWLLLEWIIKNGDTGFITKEELHWAFKGRLLSRIVEKNGLKYREIGSTTELDATEFMEYIEKCDVICNEYLSCSTDIFWQEYGTYKGIT